MIHQHNVNQSRSNMHFTQTLWATSPVLPSASRCFQTPLELSKVFSDSARAFPGALESSCSYGDAFRMLQDLTYRIVKFWSSWDLCTDLWETLKQAETAAQLWRRLRKLPRPLQSTVGDLVLYTHSSGSYITTRHFVLSYSPLLQSQILLHHNMACTIWVSLYIYIESIWLQMVLEHTWRSTWTCPLSDIRDSPHGGRCGETLELEGRERTTKIPPHLLQHPNGFQEIQQFQFKQHRNRVRRYDTTWCWGSIQFPESTKSRTEQVRPEVVKDRVCIFNVC